MMVIRQNTDYAFRVMVNLAQNWPSKTVSARALAEAEKVAYQFTCKILQVLHEAKLLESTMGPRGGYRLSRAPEEITMLDVIRAVQGPISVNRCMLGRDNCPRMAYCFVTDKMAELQNWMESFLKGVTLQELVQRQARAPALAENEFSGDKLR